MNELRQSETRRSKSASGPRKTVLYIANTDWYLFNFRKNLLKRASQEGWNVRLACGEAGYTTALAEEGWPVETLPLNSKGSNPLRELGALYKMIRLFRKERPAIAHLFTLKCVLYGCLAAPFARNTRVVGAITGMGHLFTTRSWRTRLLKTPVVLALKLALRLSDAHIVFQNSADRDEFLGHGLLSRERTSVIRGSGVDCERFKPAQIPPNTTPRLLFCGRLIAEKGIHEYLEAVSILRDQGYVFESQIAGAPYPGNPSSLSAIEVERLTQTKHHIYLGHHDDMAKLLAETDIVALPTYREGTPKALLEAAACGCIIVTTDIPGCQGIVDPGINGELAAPRSSHAIACALQRVFEKSPEDRQTMKMHSRTIAVERFSDQQVNERTLACYKTR